MDTNKPYEVYVIRSENGRYYIGLSEDADNRLKEHNQGLSKWTSRDKNWELVYKQQFNNLTEARKWENYIKRQKGGEGFKKLLQDTPGP